MNELQWLPGGARGNSPEMFVGDTFLAAVRICSDDKSREWWEITAVTVG